ncbi:hypothetical protein ES702_05307 [subsurface metagenome]
MADREDYDLGGAESVEITQPTPREEFEVVQGTPADLKATVTQAQKDRTVTNPTASNLKAELHQPAAKEEFEVVQGTPADLKATVTQASATRTVEQATEANLKAIVTVNDFQDLIDEVRLLRNCNLLVTGQTTKFLTGDDGDLEKGVIKAYSVLDTGDYSGTTNITINSKTHALSNNCVKDNNTGLMWARYVPNADIGPSANGYLFWQQWTLDDKTDISFDSATKKIASGASQFSTAALCVGRKFTVSGSTSNDGTYTVAAISTSEITTTEALADEAAGATITIATVDDLIWDFKDQANTNTLAGHDGWRIPNYLELLSIIDAGAYNPCTDATVFPSTTLTYFWTSSTHVYSTTYSYIIPFNYFTLTYTLKDATKYPVRLVRG